MVVKGGGVARATGIKKKTTKVLAKSTGKKEKNCFIQREKKCDEWDTLLDRSKLCSTLQVTAWALRFKHNSLTKKHKTKKRTGPLATEELSYAREQWIRKEQAGVQPDIKSPSWKLVTNARGGSLVTSRRTLRGEYLQTS